MSAVEWGKLSRSGYHTPLPVSGTLPQLPLTRPRKEISDGKENRAQERQEKDCDQATRSHYPSDRRSEGWSDSGSAARLRVGDDGAGELDFKEGWTGFRGQPSGGCAGRALQG